MCLEDKGDHGMGETSTGTIVKESLGWLIGLSVLMIVAGVLAIVVPPVAGVAVVLIVAWLLIFSGVTHLVFAWHTRTAGGFLWEQLLGLIYILLGGYLLLHPVAGLASLTLVLATYLLLEAILEFTLSFYLRHLHGATWLLLDGIITFVLAVMIWRNWPSSSEWVIGTLVGISMVFGGASRVAISLAARRLFIKLD
jgi:uncharacterized membrane protein HdeD (DUF308 family)